MSTLPVVPEWEPVLGRSLGALHAPADRTLIERRAAELGLQPLRWPADAGAGVRADTREAMLAATYAKRIGRAVAFSLAAFRQAFAGGRDLGDRDTVLIAAAACEMHPAAVLRGITTRSVGEALEQAGARARAAGVRSLPAIEVAGRTFEGEDGVELAARALEELG